MSEVNRQWVLIPDAVFSKGKATFKVNHLTKFAIFRNVVINKPTEEKVVTGVEVGKTSSTTQTIIYTKPRPIIPLNGYVKTATTTSSTTIGKVTKQIHEVVIGKTRIIIGTLLYILLFVLVYVRFKKNKKK